MVTSSEHVAGATGSGASVRRPCPRIAFVVQRCGPEVNGGSEALCLAVARLMQDEWDVEILTTCAKDYMTWDNFYEAGITPFENIRIRRFQVDRPRHVPSFNALSEQVLASPSTVSLNLAEEWVSAQGPLSSSLLRWLRNEQEHYDAFFFFTYLYATTALGLPLINKPICLIPTAHREKPFELPVYDKIFAKAHHLLLSTDEELHFVRKRFPSLEFSYDFAGVGVNKPSTMHPEKFRKTYNLNEPFVLYVGRIDESKGCGSLFEFWRRFKRQHPSPYRLVLIGQCVMDIPSDEDIIYLGFLSESDKWNALSAAEVLINPSPYESLSMVLLEAWSINKPTLVTGECEVTVGQSQRSQGGLWYYSYEEFCGMLIYLLNHKLKFDGSKFVEEGYSWQQIKQRYHKAFAIASDRKKNR